MLQVAALPPGPSSPFFTMVQSRQSLKRATAQNGSGDPGSPLVVEQGGTGTQAQAVFNMVNCILGAGEASFDS